MMVPDRLASEEHSEQAIESIAKRLRDLQSSIDQLPDRVAAKLASSAQLFSAETGRPNSWLPGTVSEPTSPASAAGFKLARQRFQQDRVQPPYVSTDLCLPHQKKGISPKLSRQSSSTSDLGDVGLLTEAFQTTVQAEASEDAQPLPAGRTASKHQTRRPSAIFEKAALVAAAAQCSPLIGQKATSHGSRRPSNGSLPSPTRASTLSKGKPGKGTDNPAEVRPSNANQFDFAKLKSTRFDRIRSEGSDVSFKGVVLPNVAEDDDDDDDDSTSSSDASEPSEKGYIPDEQRALTPSSGEKTKSWNLAVNHSRPLTTVRLSAQTQEIRGTQLGREFRKTSRYLSWWLFVFHPDGSVRLGWDLFMTLTIIFLAVVLPIVFSYFKQEDYSQTLAALLLEADVVLIFDVLINFTTPWDDGPRVFMKPMDIASRYVQSWFCLDLLSIWPLGLGATLGSNAYKMHMLAKMTKCAKLVYLLPRCLKRFPGALTSYLRILLPVVLFFHALACTWQSVCREDADGGDVSSDLREAYVADLYWVLMTMSSVGYGDIVPQGVTGRTFCIIVMFSSSLYGGFIISSMSHAMKRMFDDSAETKVSDAVAFMSAHRVPLHMQRRITLCLRKRVTDEMSLSKPSNLLAWLTPALQKELSTELLRSTLAKFPLFENAPETFLAQLAQAHTWIEALSGDLVVEEGQVEQELAFVVTGILMVLRPGTEATNQNCVDERQLEAGSWFGERCFFSRKQDCIRDFTVMVVQDAELAVLTLQSFDSLMDIYPQMHKQLRRLRRAVHAGTLSLAELAFIS
eukprot:TRINITY_DN74704_c0_g1_i1.p1 TRINITY_DN74704_c0_g1~~TRINITY_DN74704_c0_g1_i1.p1  ORF type:complete len:796 (-),score=112.73 TRINITY_DN74704_c0_g1_i1:296-2683(-)